MEQFEYMKLKLSNLPKDFIKEYDLTPKVDQNGYVSVEIRRRMYRLTQAGLLAQQLIKKLLNAKWYSKSTLSLATGPTPGVTSRLPSAWDISASST